MSQHDLDRRSRVWLPAVAAVAALLVSGAVVLTHQVEPRDHSYTNFTMSQMDVNSTETRSTVDQCWRAAESLRKTVQYPDRSEWQPTLAAVGASSSLVAFKTKGRPLFCEVTSYSVTLSDPAADPAYAAGSKTGALMLTESGAIGGVVDPTWPAVTVSTNYMNEPYSHQAFVRDGLFIYLTYRPSTGSAVAVRRSDRDPATLLPKPRQAFGTVDASLDRGDRSSTRGTQLARCLEDAGTRGSIPNVDSWNPGARIKSNSQQLTLAKNAMGISACVEKPGEKPVFLPYLTTKTWAPEPTLLTNVPAVAGRPVLAGLLPHGVKQMRLTFADNTTMDADVGATTFAALTPSTPTSCTLFGEDDQILYIGPIAAS